MVPTAQALCRPVADTPNSPLRALPDELGLGTCVHAEPFQCSMTVTHLGSQLSPRAMPTAQALLPRVADTATTCASPSGVGLGTTVQAWPFQCSIRVSSWPANPGAPTAQALREEVADPPFRTL